MFTTIDSKPLVNSVHHGNPPSFRIPGLQVASNPIKPPLLLSRQSISTSSRSPSPVVDYRSYRAASTSRTVWTYKPIMARRLSMASRSPSPLSYRSDSDLSSSNYTRRLFPQNSETLGLRGLENKDKSPVVYDAGLSFIMGLKKQQLRHQFRTKPAHHDPATGSAQLSARISDFLQRTDHVMEEWKRLGRKDPDEMKKMMNGLGRSHSSTNIIIKGFQLMNRDHSTRSPTCSRISNLQDDIVSEADELSEITVDLSEERSSGTLATERLELETAERLRLEKELQDVQAEKKHLQENAERLEFELLCAHTGATDENGVGESDDGEDGEGGGAYKQRYERAVRELEFTRRRLQQQHQDDLEQLIGLKKQLEKKLSDAYEEVEEQRQVVSQWKRKVQKLNSETNDLRLLLEEQNSRNNLLEKKQRKFDAEFQLLTDELRQERANKERAMRERELALGDKYTMDQNLSAVKLELELKEQKVAALSKELDELTFGGNTEEDVALLKKTKHQLESKLKDQEEELDDLAGQVQLLEQAKLRLEMSIEQMRKENRRELSQRDEELEEVRCNAQKKVKALECQLENEHEERTLLLRERHEMERRLADYEERLRASRTTDQETLQKLRRDLKRTKALLRDAQATIHQSKADTPNKAVIRLLKNQLEDAECARVAAVKARQVAEAEARETTAGLEEALRARSEAEERIATLTRECSQLQSQLDENEEELAEVLKKYRAAVTQLSTEQISLQEQASRVAELETERASLKEQLAELSSRLENIEIHGDPTSSLTVKRLQLKTKELESKLELEQTTRSRMEVQIARLKETTERLQSECETLRAKEYSAQENARRSARTVREMRVEMASVTSKEQEGQVQKRDLEKRLEAAENELNAARTDLRLALQRIEDLQCAIQGELEEGEEANEGASDSDGESVTSEDSMDAFLANHTLHTASAASLSRGSLDSFRSAERSSSERLQVKKLNDTVTKDSSYA